jgi:polysaccharide pyruvyl transferase WcaK-like protein
MKIGVVYGHVSKNIGDLALNCGTVQLILNTVPYADVHVVFLNPKQNCLDAAKASFEGLKNVTFTSFHTRNLKKSRDITFNELSKAMTYVLEPKRFITDAGLNGCDLLLYNGGEHLFTYKDRENPISNIDLTWRVLPALVAKSVGMRFIILPVTVGPLEVPIVTQMISSFFHLSDGAAIREPRSAVFTAKLLDGNPLPALLDPAFFMPIPQRRIYNNEPTIDIIMRLEDIGLRIGIKNTRIALEKYRHNGFTSSRSFQFIIAVARSFFQEIGGKVNLVVQSSSADHALADAVTQVLTKEGYGNKVQLVQPTSLSEYQEEISRANFIVSSRLHTCILGLLLGKACLGVYFVEHGHKIPGVFEMLGLPDYCLNLSKDSPESLAGYIITLYLKLKHAFE